MNRILEAIRIYSIFLKVRIVELIVIVTLPSIALSINRFNPLNCLLFLFISIITSMGSGAFNNTYDRNIDRCMDRTKNRPTALGYINKTQGYLISITLLSTAIIISLLYFGYLFTLLLLISIFIYTVLYTIFLKRKTYLNIVIGGIVGSFPSILSSIAMTGYISINSILVGLLIFFWTPVHYWPLSLIAKDEYKRINIPMISVVKTVRSIIVHMSIYNLLMILVSLLLLITYKSSIYFKIILIIVDILWIYFNINYYINLIKFNLKDSHLYSYRIFHISIIYISVIMFFMSIDILMSQ